MRQRGKVTRKDSCDSGGNSNSTKLILMHAAAAEENNNEIKALESEKESIQK